MRCGLCGFLIIKPQIALHHAMWCGLKFSQNHNRTAPHFCGHMCDTMYMMRFERLEVDIFFKFWAFPTSPKQNFPFV